MPAIIHKVLHEKLQRLPEWERFRGHFELLTGLPVELAESRDALPKRCPLPPIEVEVKGILVGYLVVVSGEQPDGGRISQAKADACRHILDLAGEHFRTILGSAEVNGTGRMPGAVLKTCRWIRERALLGEVRLTDAAAACGLSPSHLSRLFHGSTGMTFQEYVSRFRLEKAGELLLATDLPVTRIAFEAGFQSISQFHRSFRKLYGMPPRAYRQGAKS